MQIDSRSVASILAILLLTGCARFETVQFRTSQSAGPPVERMEGAALGETPPASRVECTAAALTLFPSTGAGRCTYVTYAREEAQVRDVRRPATPAWRVGHSAWSATLVYGLAAAGVGSYLLYEGATADEARGAFLGGGGALALTGAIGLAAVIGIAARTHHFPVQTLVEERPIARFDRACDARSVAYEPLLLQRGSRTVWLATDRRGSASVALDQLSVLGLGPGTVWRVTAAGAGVRLGEATLPEAGCRPALVRAARSNSVKLGGVHGAGVVEQTDDALRAMVVDALRPLGQSRGYRATSDTGQNSHSLRVLVDVLRVGPNLEVAVSLSAADGRILGRRQAPVVADLQAIVSVAARLADDLVATP
jgi:hypothetical protein